VLPMVRSGCHTVGFDQATPIHRLVVVSNTAAVLHSCSIRILHTVLCMHTACQSRQTPPSSITSVSQADTWAVALRHERATCLGSNRSDDGGAGWLDIDALAVLVSCIDYYPKSSSKAGDRQSNQADPQCTTRWPCGACRCGCGTSPSRCPWILPARPSFNRCKAPPQTGRLPATTACTGAAVRGRTERFATDDRAHSLLECAHGSTQQSQGSTRHTGKKPACGCRSAAATSKHHQHACVLRHVGYNRPYPSGQRQ
jgi:hypothetical protein